MSRRRPPSRLPRVLELVGFLLMAVGLIGFFLARDVERGALSSQQLELLGLEEGRFHASILIAGRDELYLEDRSEPVYGEPVYNEAGEFECWRYSGQRSATGVHTDAVAFVLMRGSELTLILLPGNLLLAPDQARLNGIYLGEGASGLRRRVADLLAIPVDYHVVIDLDIFARLVDALGGVTVDVPRAMRRTDCDAGITVDLQPGVQVLDGRQASYFIRYRDPLRGDIERLDNMKQLAYGLLERVKRIELGSARRLPGILEALLEEVETNASPALLSRVLARIDSLHLEQAVTLPVVEVEQGGVSGVSAEPAEVESFLALIFGGTPRKSVEAPAVDLMITDRSGRQGLGEWYRSRLLRLGVAEERIAVRQGSADGAPTRVLATVAAWEGADYYADLVNAGKQQVDRFDGAGTQVFGVELVLGRDAGGRYQGNER